jgi:malonyl-CoA O-methyltransferase
MSGTPEFEIDAAAAQRHFCRTAATAEQTAFLARELAARMAERLDYIRFKPARILDLGCGHGADLALLAKHYPQSQHLGLDFALPVLQQNWRAPGFIEKLLGKKSPAPRICANAAALPLKRASIDLVWSNLLLNWVTDPMDLFKEIHRILNIDGLLMFCTLGPDSLRELRSALPATAGERVHRFIDMHDLGDCLVRAGFSDPVMDMQTLTLTYSSADTLFTDLRHSGCSNAAQSRPKGLSGKAGWQQARQTIEATRQDGRIPVSVEVIFGHAWRPAPRQHEDGRSVINFHASRPQRPAD